MKKCIYCEAVNWIRNYPNTVDTLDKKLKDVGLSYSNSHNNWNNAQYDNKATDPQFIRIDISNCDWHTDYSRPYSHPIYIKHKNKKK